MIPLKEHPMAQNFSLIKRGFLKKQLLRESTMVAVDSMMVLEEFERFEEDLPFNEHCNGKNRPDGGSIKSDRQPPVS
jgi:hypothetical protein